MNFLKRLFTWPNRVETRWVGQSADDYQPTATRTLILSVISMVVALIVGNSYLETHGHESGYEAVMWMVYGGLDVAVLLLAAVLAKDTWSGSGRSASWFFCHALFAFLGGAIVIMAGMFAVVGYAMLKIIQLFLTSMAGASVGSASSERQSGSNRTGSSEEDSNSDDSSRDEARSPIEMSNFDEDMTVRTTLGPDRHLTRTEGSIYGDIYTDNDSGKQVRVTETDAFGHPTKTEEVWP